MHILEIKNLCAKIEDKEILKDFNLKIKSGEIHAIMGPNGTGKSTLSKVIMGDCNYTVTSGEITYDNKNINDLTVDERARLGIFLGMQLPTEIEGVTNADFLRTALHNKEGKDFKLMNFIKELNSTWDKLNMDKDMIHRSVNKGFSGGEKKKNEIIQMYILKPSLILLDEIDSGLDVDSLKLVGQNVVEYFNNSESGILLITHYQRLLDYIKPDFIHVMMNGTIIKTGDISLVKIIEEKGYEFIKDNLTNCEIHE
ncbi:MAG: Fe-S cluster assembly ATPase SufC [Bacilli bacterium]